jgi:Low-density lipoprotein receptor repeat class B
MARTLCSRTVGGVVGVLLGLLAAAVFPVPARAKVYFTAFPGEGGTAIERAGFDGGELEALQLEPTGFDDGLAVDLRDGVMYWSDTNASVIRRANLNGSEAQIIVDDFGWEPLGVALDLDHGKLYWNDRQGIKRANLDGTGEELLSSGAATGFMTLDLAAQRMYWVSAGAIKSAEMNPGPTVTTVVSGQAAPFGLAVDHDRGKLYWLQLNKKNQIRRANLDGTEIETIVERPGAGFEGGLAIDPAAGRLYWTEATARDIASSNLDGTQAQTLFSTGEDSPVGLAIESVDPRPASGAPALVEGRAQVGSALSCNPGTWTGTGPISLTYRWLLGGNAIEGVTGPVYVPSADAAGGSLACNVTASDRVAQATATSAPVTVAALPPEARSTPPPLVAGIALATLNGSGSRVRVPVFTSLRCAATLTAQPVRRARRRRARAAAARPRRARTRTARRMLAAGRSTITLTGLVPGTTYRLTLSLRSADGRSARDTATLVMRRRRRA